MSTNACMLKVGKIKAKVVRKAIKNLHLSVLPPNGAVRVSVPLRIKDDVIRVLLATRLGWIRKQQVKFASQERQTRRKYVSGENHYLWGKGRRMEVIYINQTPQVSLKGNDKIILSVRPNCGLAKREQLMTDWYRKELRLVATSLIGKWSKKIDIRLSSWGIKKMKTRWGTCNQRARRIWLNLELAKKSEQCLEYIIVHEMTHILEKKHNDRFKAYMDRFMPQWRNLKDELNRSVLAHETWKC